MSKRLSVYLIVACIPLGLIYLIGATWAINQSNFFIAYSTILILIPVIFAVGYIEVYLAKKISSIIHGVKNDRE